MKVNSRRAYANDVLCDYLYIYIVIVKKKLLLDYKPYRLGSLTIRIVKIKNIIIDKSKT